jgi:hypothetical protein
VVGDACRSRELKRPSRALASGAGADARPASSRLPLRTRSSRLTCRGPSARSPPGASVPTLKGSWPVELAGDSDFLAPFWRIGVIEMACYGTEGQRFESSRARCRTPSAGGDFRPSPNAEGWQHGWQQGNADGVATAGDRGAGGLPAWFEVRRGLPRRGSPAQAVGRNAGRSPRDQAQARRRGAREAARPDAARVQPPVAGFLRGLRPRQRA